MTIAFTSGATVSTASEANLFSVTGEKYYATWVFTHNMTSAETVIIKAYVQDINAGVLREWGRDTISGVQTSPAFYIHLVPTSAYKVTIQRTAGTDKSYTWTRAEIV
jgi:hypothetical protein